MEALVRDNNKEVYEMVRHDYGWNAKLLSLGLVLGLPLLGLMLISTSQAVQDPIYLYAGVLLVMLFPLTIAMKLLRYKGK